MTVLITLHDVEPAVRLNARLEAEGIETVLVSPLDDVRAEIKRAKPTLIFITGDLTDSANVGVLRESDLIGNACGWAIGQITGTPLPVAKQRIPEINDWFLIQQE